MKEKESKKKNIIEALGMAQQREGKGKYILRLYIAGTTPKSMRAVHNLRQICSKHLEGRHDLEVIDTYQNPQTVIDNKIIAIPTLIKELPPPLCRLVGDLSDTKKVLSALDITL